MRSEEVRADLLITVTAFDGGGTERYAEDLAIGLAQMGIKIVVSVDSGPLDRVRRLVSAGIPIRVIAPGPLEASEYVNALDSLVEYYQPRLIHVNGWAHYEQIIDVAAARRIPLVYTNHGTPRPPLFREWLGLNSIPFALYRERALAKRGAPAISISWVGLKTLGLRLGHRVRSVVVYNGVPHIDAAATSECHGKAPLIIWLGSLITRKRPLLAIQVFERILEIHPTAQLMILGDGPLLSDVQALANRLPPGSVQVRGFCHTVIDSLRAADVYLQTAVNEGLAYSVLDAMSVGLPVVATDAGATKEAVLHGETGLVCAVDDAEQLANAVIKLLDSPEVRVGYGRAGLMRVRAQFGLERMVSETISAYAALCGVDLLKERTVRPQSKVAGLQPLNTFESAE